jgi:D-alanyl-D-alanine carboxypeptidase
MVFSRRLFVGFVLGVVAPFVATAASAKRAAPTRPTATDNGGAYKGAIVTDAATGSVLFEDHADYAGAPASMTKLMTFAVLYDKLKAGSIALNTPVHIANEDNIGGTQVFLDPRETFPVEELIYAMMIQSANDAARALARSSAGSVQTFVEQMNAKAREIGMTHTTFHSPHGLPPSSRKLADTDMTTPRDYAILCRYVVQNTDVLKYTSVRKRDFAPERAKGPFKMENHNKLLGKVSGVDGLKTGFTAAAGYCISVTGERNGHRLIVVIMGALGPGGQRDLGRWRDMKAIELLEHGFANLPAGSPTFAAQKAVLPNSAAATPGATAAAPTNDSPLSASTNSAPATTTASKPAAAASGNDMAVKFSLPPAPKKK